MLRDGSLLLFCFFVDGVEELQKIVCIFSADRSPEFLTVLREEDDRRYCLHPVLVRERAVGVEIDFYAAVVAAFESRFHCGISERMFFEFLARTAPFGPDDHDCQVMLVARLRQARCVRFLRAPLERCLCIWLRYDVFYSLFFDSGSACIVHSEMGDEEHDRHSADGERGHSEAESSCSRGHGDFAKRDRVKSCDEHEAQEQ